MPVANTDAAHLARLRDYWAQHRTLPASYERISELLGFKTKNAAVKLGRRLIEAGYLQSAPGGKLAPAERFFEVPLVDAPVRAGSPTTVDTEHFGEALTLASAFFDVPSETVLVPVRGDSMREAGVLDGDFAIVERARRAQAGQFVVAVADDEFTVKELSYEGRKPVLLPRNREYAIIRPEHSLEIFGIVRGILRRYTNKPARVRRTTGAAT